MKTNTILFIVSLLLALLTCKADAGSTPSAKVNVATAGPAGTAVSISNSAATKLLKGSPTRKGWTAICIDTSASGPEIAALMMPGGTDDTVPPVEPSATVGFPLMANTYVNDEDFVGSNMDAIHNRWDAYSLLSGATNCYTVEE